MSRKVGQAGSAGHTKAETGPLRWMDREALMQTYSEKSDVWAYGCTLIEMCTGQEPFPEFDIINAAVGVRDQGWAPQIPAGAPKTLDKVMKACFTLERDLRPGFAEVVEMFD